MSRATQLRDAQRAMNRVRHAERQLDQFRGYADLSDAGQQRTLLKLQADVAAAQRDAAWFRAQLDECLAVAGVDL
jgi:hypothetical protein